MNLSRMYQSWKVKNTVRFDLSFFGQKGFVTWHKRPVKLKDWPKKPEIYSCNDVAIVVQGPYVSKASFTLETLRQYRHTYPSVPIILSTWRGSAAKDAKALKELCINVIESEPLKNAFYGNLNRQQLTTLSGLEMAAELGCENALKTRSDQRLYGRNFLGQLAALSGAFPLKELNPRGITSRVIVTYQNSFLDRPLSASDFLQFGHTNDLLKMWKSLDTLEVSPHYAPEQVLLGSLALELGWSKELLFTSETWSEVRAELLGFVDATALDLFWFKYSSREHLWRRYGSEPLTELSPLDWLESMKEH